jgi:AraC family transcriptional regulator
MIMEPKIIEKGQMILVGLSFYGDPFEASAGWMEENEIGRLWNRFMTLLADQGQRIKHVKGDHVAYEVHIESEETAKTGNHEVFVGVEVAQLEDTPVELLVKVLPSTTYAVFTFRGNQITSDWSRTIYHEWMPVSSYQVAYRYGIQLYDQRFKGLDNLDESELDVYVPVKLVSA